MRNFAAPDEATAISRAFSIGGSVSVDGINALNDLWNQAGKHPLSGVVTAWQKDANAIHYTEEQDKTTPAGILKYPMGSIRDIVFDSELAGALKRFDDHNTPNSMELALFELPEQNSIIRPVQNLIVVDDQGTTKAGAVAHAVRIFLEAVMALPPKTTNQRVKFTLGDLIKFLNPDGKFNRTNQLPYILKGIDDLHNAGVQWNTGLWLPVIARSRPTIDSDKDFPIVLDVELPPNTTQGAMVIKNTLRLTGKKSLPQFNAYLAMCDVWDRFGTQGGVIIDPTRPIERRDNDGYLLDASGNRIFGTSGKPLKKLHSSRAASQLDRERNPDADRYLILTPFDMVKACFPELNYEALPPNTKRPYLARAREALEGLKKAGYIQIEKRRDGWRVMPVPEHVQMYRALKTENVY